MVPSTEEVAYFSNSGSTQIEKYFGNSNDDVSYPPYTGFGGSSPSSLAVLEATLRPPADWAAAGTIYSGSARTVCPLRDRSSKPVYYFGGSPIKDEGDGSVPTNITTLFLEASTSINLTGTKGIAFVGEFQGGSSADVSSGYVDEAVFYTERACTDFDLEYGFARVITPSSDDTIFYYSDYTNCSVSAVPSTGPPNTGCSTTSPAFAGRSENSTQYQITGLPSGNNLFRAYPVYNYGTSKWDMYFEVWNSSDTAIDTCTISQGGSAVVSNANCAYTIQDSSFNASGVGSPFASAAGYLAIVGESQGSISNPTTFKTHVTSLQAGY